ncbi:hypothetical protein FQN51_004763 [Onygenales sp. PD_10]|nr:hypothetical protein FQN51_004763 [Onygenales sp. PD_10]
MSRVSNDVSRLEVHLRFEQLLDRPRGDNASSGAVSGRNGIGAATQRKEEREEENRLLGSCSRGDPDGVRFAPGDVSRMNRIRNSQKLGAFKPVDTISGRDPPRDFKKPALARPNHGIAPNPRPENRTVISGADRDVSRPRKRQRTSVPDTPRDSEVIELNDDDSTTHLVSPRSTKLNEPSHRRSSEGSSIQSFSTSSKRKGSQGTSEFWATEETVRSWKRKPAPNDSADEESFTKAAREERIGSNVNARPNRTSFEGPGTLRRPELLVEISPMAEVESDKHSNPNSKHTPARLDQTFVDMNGKHRNSDPQESPDELAGGVTIGTRNASFYNDHPADITPTTFSLNPRGGRRGDRKRDKLSHETEHHITRFDDETWDKEDNCSLIVDESSNKIYARTADGNCCPGEIDIKNIFLISHNVDSSLKVQVKTNNFADSTKETLIEFATPKGSYDFWKRLSDIDGIRRIRWVDRERHVSQSTRDESAIFETDCLCSSWMDKMFTNALSQKGDRQVRGSKRGSPQEKPLDATIHPSAQPKRQKISDRLMDNNGTTNEPASGNMLRRAPRRVGLLSSPPTTHSHPVPEVVIPVKKFGEDDNPRSYRVTRSHTQQQPTTIHSDHESSPSPVQKANKWNKPLVYPRLGKKKAEVEFHDLERLGDGEFLNDNLIGFYIRFLEHHLERNRPDVAKRVYFFNSYFFASLTNTPRGKKGINYQAVEKWTRNVDIFSYDYIVVPINENAHWYMAIICNLPSLTAKDEDAEDAKPKTQEGADDTFPKKATDDAGNPVIGPPEENKPVEEAANTINEHSPKAGKDKILQASFNSLSLSDKGSEKRVPETPPKESECDESDWPDAGENGPTKPGVVEDVTNATPLPEPPMSLRSGKPRTPTDPRRTPHGPRYNLKQPIVITFDSLGLPRPPTVRILRQYLEEEAKSKRAFTLDPRKLMGMTAKQIPQQPNFSDCGLYLLAYLEKFVRDPDLFINKVLQKEMNGGDWPKMESRVLRRRLRTFLHKLHDEEERAKENNLDGEDQMVDANPLKILLVGPERRVEMAQAKDGPAESKKSPISKQSPKPASTVQKEGTPKPESENKPLPSTPKRSPAQPSHKTPRSQEQQSNAAIVVEDEPVPDSQFKGLLQGIQEVAAAEDPSKVEIPQTPTPEPMNGPGYGQFNESPARRSPRTKIPVREI